MSCSGQLKNVSDPPKPTYQPSFAHVRVLTDGKLTSKHLGIKGKYRMRVENLFIIMKSSARFHLAGVPNDAMMIMSLMVIMTMMIMIAVTMIMVMMMQR